MKRFTACKGMTLPEVLVTTVVLGIIVVSVTSLFMAASSTYRVGAVEQAAERTAAHALERMVPDLRAAMLVAPGIGANADTYLMLTLPNRLWDTGSPCYQLAADATGAMGLVPGDTVHYYRGNTAGELDPAGSYLWRMVVHSDGSVGKMYRIASGVVDNPNQAPFVGPKPMFVYWPNEVLRESVEVTITVTVRESARTATHTAQSEVALRNL